MSSSGVRTLVNPNDPADVEEVHALQDALKVDQPGDLENSSCPNWDKVSQDKVREALLGARARR